MKVQGKTTLLLHCSIIGGCVTIKAKMFLIHTENMLEKHLDHEVKKSCTGHRIVSYQTVTFILVSNSRGENLFGICIIQRNRMTSICRSKGNKPQRSTNI